MSMFGPDWTVLTLEKTTWAAAGREIWMKSGLWCSQTSDRGGQKDRPGRAGTWWNDVLYTVSKSIFVELVFYSNFVPTSHSFWDIRLQKMSRPWNPGQRSLKVIGTDTGRPWWLRVYGACDVCVSEVASCGSERTGFGWRHSTARSRPACFHWRPETNCPYSRTTTVPNAASSRTTTRRF